MLRRLRFGTLSLFATMLLVVSAAGFWKFHRDLYVEEAAVLEALASAGCNVIVRRSPWDSDGQKAPAARASDESSAAYFSRIESLTVQGDPPDELRLRIAQLPGLTYLRIYDGSDATFGGPPKATPFPIVAEVIGAPVPDFAKAQLVRGDLDQPHPHGTRINDDEAARTLASIRRAWSAPPTPPERFVSAVEARSPGLLPRETRFAVARDGAAYLAYRQLDRELAALEISDGSTWHDFAYGEEGWRLVGRRSGTHAFSEVEEGEPALGSIVASILPKPRRDAAELDRVTGLERLDDVRVRVDFNAFERSVMEPTRADVESVVESSMVIREDLDWRVESVRELAQSIVLPQNPATRIAEEHRYESRGGFVRHAESLVGRTADGDPFLASPDWTQTLDAWSLNPDFEDDTFSVDRFVSEPPPPPRDLPFWRWYRVTFAISLALFAFLIGRSAVGLFGRTRTSPVAANKSVAEGEASQDANAEAPTPGS